MKVDILYITYNRLHVTKMTLPNLLESTNYPFGLTIVDNGSSDNTAEYLAEVINEYESKQHICLILNNKNEGLSKPTNEFWEKSEAQLVGKIDNDILVPRGWLGKMVDAHRAVSDLAVIGGFHFPKEIFDYEKCKHNIYQYANINILRQPYIGGNYIAKRDILLSNGFLEEPSATGFKLGGWTGYQTRLTEKRYIVGYYYPLVFFDHIHDSPDAYYKSVRGISKRKYIKWEKKDGKKLLTTKWSY